MRHRFLIHYTYRMMRLSAFLEKVSLIGGRYIGVGIDIERTQLFVGECTKKLLFTDIL